MSVLALFKGIWSTEGLVQMGYSYNGTPAIIMETDVPRYLCGLFSLGSSADELTEPLPHQVALHSNFTAV